jgi:hypothetical protein
MKAIELMIGNYYQYAGDNGIIYTQVKEIKHNQFGLLGDFDGTNFEICKAIPLTEEWLVKFGFKQISERVYIKNYHYGYEFGITNIFIIKNDNCFMRYKHIQHVHELQNLYFALTGEELSL